MRLDKFVSHATGMPRDHARRAIRKKQVQVDETLVTDAARHVAATARITLDGQLLQLAQPRYLMLFKPAGYVCATTDSDHPTVLDLITDRDTGGLSIAGRLDIDTTGLVLLSDDGQWLHRATSPRHRHPKVYEVQLQEALDQQTIDSFATGIMLHGESRVTLPAQCRATVANCAEVTLHEGRYHQVKRMFAACGNHVLALHRRQIGGIVLDPSLEPGDYRELTDAEVAEFLT